MKSKIAAMALALATLSASSANAVQISIGSLKDATIFQNNANNSSGGSNGVFAGSNGTSPRRGLMAFDVAGSIPAGATIESVQLTLYLGQIAGSGGSPTLPGGPEENIQLFRLEGNWGEGSTGAQSGDSLSGGGQGTAAAPGDATWNSQFHTTDLWTTPGGDFAATVSASTLVGTGTQLPYMWNSTPALVADVQGWLDDPSGNFGWLIKNAVENVQNFRVFYSRNTQTPAYRPQLQVMYSVVPEPTTMLLSLIALVGVRRSLR